MAAQNTAMNLHLVTRENDVSVDEDVTGNETLTSDQVALAKIVELGKFVSVECLTTDTTVSNLDSLIVAGRLPDGPTTLDLDLLDDAFKEIDDDRIILPEP